MDEKPTILYVEDEPMLRELIAEVLANDGIACLPVATGVDAVRIIERKGHNFRLLISDVRLPGSVDGFAVADRFQAVYPDGEVIIMSAHVHPDDILSLCKEKRQVFLKPMRIRDLVETVRDTLNQSRDASRGIESA